MSSLISSDKTLLGILSRATDRTSQSGEESSDVAGHTLYNDIVYTENEQADINRWSTQAMHISASSEDEAKTAERLLAINAHLATHSTVLGSKPSIADVALFARIAPIARGWSRSERTGEHGYHHIMRHLNFVQNSPFFRLNLEESEKIAIDEDNIECTIQPVDAKATKERKRKEKRTVGDDKAPTSPSAASSGGLVIRQEESAARDQATQTNEAMNQHQQQGAKGKKEKKEKAAKTPKQAPVAASSVTMSPALIDLRVGHILKAENHPNADSLYVSTVACGDPPGTENTFDFEGQVVRTVCSGLRAFMPLDDLQGRKIVAVCNLKPVTMRGVKSCAMVLAASPRIEEGSDSHSGPVELVNVPTSSEAGERVCFEGWDGEPERVLNPKKKVWETCQIGFTTTSDLEVAFDPAAVKELNGKSGIARLVTPSGVCTVASLRDAIVR